MSIKLFEHQKKALDRIQTGCILNGGTGSGKSITALAYYFTQEGGKLDPFVPMKRKPRDLYIITTARKRDTLEWEEELSRFRMSPHEDLNALYGNKIVIDSWNNITKYHDVRDAFFIFDEDRVTGNGVWVTTFLALAKRNDWIILSATPGDVWSDYIPVFIANGFYRNKTEFIREHVVYSRYVKWKIDRYLNTGRLIRLRNKILIDMEFDRHTVQHHNDIYCDYDIQLYKDTIKNRWNYYEEKPIEQAAGLCYTLRKIVNSSEARQVKLMEIIENVPRAIIFYNFDYERDILLNLPYGEEYEVAEWSGHKHQEIPDSEKWVYIVQYVSGCEGWNCIKTDSIIFFSMNYSYKVVTQACGRIDRLNTPFTDLHYYHLKSRSGIDLAISKALSNKKKFNERKFAGWD